ncbi:MAG: anaerobic ribonucleoside triphosphate reductase [Clostridiaceae bacterium]|nr:anaerobic ribonucleoside triphosphate reductase [Clostridiaceae bacterium]
MITRVIKRDGREASYNIEKIANAIYKALEASAEINPQDAGLKRDALSMDLAGKVAEYLDLTADRVPHIEDIQDMVERVLMEAGYPETAKRYILYRAERTRVREMNTRLMQTYHDITNHDSRQSDIKRENANIDGDTAMGTMLKYGSEGAKMYYQMFMLKPEHSQAHQDGDIHIHDLDFYALTLTCCQIDLLKLFAGGFSTGHGHLREPRDIRSYAALACIAIQSNQNDMHGGQSVVNFDYAMAKGVGCTYRKTYRQNLAKALELIGGAEQAQDLAKQIIARVEQSCGLAPGLTANPAFQEAEAAILQEYVPDRNAVGRIQAFTTREAWQETDKATYQAMEALVHNLNSMHSRAGAQTPFSSLNYGMDVSQEGRMAIRNLLLATESGLGNGETAIFPIHIFRVKKGINFNPGEPNYDLFKLACRCSARRMFPNFAFQDAPFNLKYYDPNNVETEVAYMGCRTRVVANNFDPEREITYRRGNLSFTSINLPRCAILAKGDLSVFYKRLDNMLELAAAQLLERFEVQARKHVYNFPFLMGQGLWLDSEKLDWDDEIRSVIRHGTLSIGFIGLAETLVAMTGSHHGQSAAAQELGLAIIGRMRDFCDRQCTETGLNFSLLATPAEGLSGRFLRMDRKEFGKLPGITDKEYYTNSFHIPVRFEISAFEKIRLEAPYHELTNAGHITYVEMDGDTTQNIEAFEKIIRFMAESGIGYGAINHPIDRDPVCGYNGIIGDTCPACGRSEEADEVPFDRIRRITGYLVGTLDRFNNAKRAEEHDRVKHGLRE